MNPSPQALGLIGAGRMATALARGCTQSSLIKADRIFASDPSEAARQRFSEAIPGAHLVVENSQVLAQAKIVILAVKPQTMEDVLQEIGPLVRPMHLLVSIAAGFPLHKMADRLPVGTRLVRVMPNTPCLIGMGVSCYSRGKAASEEDGRVVRLILEKMGAADEVEEKLLDVVTGLSGSGPAFVYRVIEEMAGGGMRLGLSPDLALRLAAGTARGAAEMVLSTGQSPAELRQQVTSPGGTTQAGLETLEQLKGPEAFRAAVEAATHRSIELGQS